MAVVAPARGGRRSEALAAGRPAGLFACAAPAINDAVVDSGEEEAEERAEADGPAMLPARPGLAQGSKEALGDQLLCFAADLVGFTVDEVDHPVAARTYLVDARLKETLLVAQSFLASLDAGRELVVEVELCLGFLLIIRAEPAKGLSLSLKAVRKLPCLGHLLFQAGEHAVLLIDPLAQLRSQFCQTRISYELLNLVGQVPCRSGGELSASGSPDPVVNEAAGQRPSFLRRPSGAVTPLF
ncbi:hypothetical protein VTK26DRAFT_5068 [Humicola hyalothermophila]